MGTSGTGTKSNRRSFGATRTWLCVAACAAVVSVASAQAGSSHTGNPAAQVEPQTELPTGTAAETQQKKMQDDAARLVELARQLKISVDKTNRNVLSIEVIRQAERVEKLAHEMRTAPQQ